MTGAARRLSLLFVFLLLSHAASAGPSARVRYAIVLDDEARAASAPLVRCEITDAPSPLVLVFPAWLPGAYELRYFGRDVRALAVESEGRALAVRREGPTRVVIEGHAAGARVVVRYRTSASLFSDDGAEITDAHAYFNPGALVPIVRGLESSPHELVLEALPAGWRVLSALATGDPAAPRLEAPSYAALTDGPIEAAPGLAVAERALAGARFVIAIDRDRVGAPAEQPPVPARLLDDLAGIVEAERALAGPLPFARYLLLIHLSDRLDHAAALEHSASTSIIVPTSSLDGDDYAELRHMISHELFHAWNARRLVPAELVVWDPEGPQASRALWITEGLTEHASLVAENRAGLLTRAQLQQALNEALTRGRAAERAGLSLEELAMLAFAAPSRLGPDMDAYYAVGQLVSLALVAALLERSQGRVGLAELLHALVPENDAGSRAVDSGLLARTVDTLVPARAGQVPLSRVLLDWVTKPFTLAALAPGLARLGLPIVLGDARASALGIVVEGTPPIVRELDPGGAFVRAGVHAGDRLLAIDGVPATAALLAKLATRVEDGALLLELERAGATLRLPVRTRTIRVGTAKLGAGALAEPRSPSIRTLRALLLGDPPPR